MQKRNFASNPISTTLNRNLAFTNKTMKPPIKPQTSIQRLERILAESWELLSQRIASKRVKINKEASLQLQYASILASLGGLYCVEPNEVFSIELESANAGRNIDITCSLGDANAAIELKCFKKESRRGLEADMYDVLVDIDRLLSYKKDYKVCKFICLTDNPYYATVEHGGHAGSVTVRDGKKYLAGASIKPGWAGRWKSKSRDEPICFTQSILCEWRENKGWYELVINL